VEFWGEREREMKGKAGESACKRGKVFPLGAVRAGLKYEKWGIGQYGQQREFHIIIFCLWKQ
jgi:hypothetical protein